MHDASPAQTWLLYAVADITGDQRIEIGEIVHSDRWEVRIRGADGLRDLPEGHTLAQVTERWLRELQEEADAANGQSNGATPLSEGRMEWRRVLHNNHLRIGPAQRVEPSL